MLRMAQHRLVMLYIVSVVTAQTCPPAEATSIILQAPRRWAAQLGWNSSDGNGWTGVTCDINGALSM